MKRTINLPTFHGTYGSIWDDDDNWYYEMTHEYEVQHLNDWDFHFKEWLNDLGNEYTYFMEGLYKQHIYEGLSLSFESSWSPAYYNFTTDKIYATLEVENDEEFISKVLELMDANKEKLAQIIKENHTSCDGFISFMENDFDYWKEHLLDKDELYLDYTLAYLMIIIHKPCDGDIELEAYECIGVRSYDYWYPNSEEAKKEWEEIVAKGL